MTVKELNFTDQSLSIKEQLKERVAEWTERYADTITENYRLYHVRNGYTPRENLMKFKVESGRKYYKIIQQDFDTFQNRNEYRDGSVHAFVNKETGQVYKPASWKSPHTKYVRFDMRVINDRAKLHDPNFTGWAGGYLYLR
tara:strand:- start:1837 stop:2259 length:423 start_codon:yes stop_codon:yes gene_type:complete